MATRSIATVIVALTLTACGSGAATTEAGDPAVDEWVTIVASHHGDWRERRSAKTYWRPRMAAKSRLKSPH